MNKMRIAVFEGALTTQDFEKHTGVTPVSAVKELIDHIHEQDEMEKRLRHRIQQLKWELKRK